MNCKRVFIILPVIYIIHQMLYCGATGLWYAAIHDRVSFAGDARNGAKGWFASKNLLDVHVLLISKIQTMVQDYQARTTFSAIQQMLPAQRS